MEPDNGAQQAAGDVSVSEKRIYFALGETPARDEIHVYFKDLPPLPGETGTQYTQRARIWAMTRDWLADEVATHPSLWQRIKAYFA